MAKFNKNEENDILLRVGIKAVSTQNKTSKVQAEKLKDANTKKAVMDFIFNGNENSVSPLGN